MVTRILVLEDDERIVRMLQRYLGERGFVVEGTSDPIVIERTIDDFLPDLLLLDWMLPGRTGLDTLRELRRKARYAALPVIMLTAKNEELDRVEGLLTGADDYIAKPFSLAELEARVVSVLRRAARQTFVYQDSRLQIDPRTKQLVVDGQAQTLSLQEWAVLEYLLMAASTVDREQLISHVWGANPPASARSIDNVIMRLRRVLAESDEPRYIVTDRGHGYRFVRHDS